MIDKRTQLTVLYFDAGIFVDHSIKAVDYSRDPFDVQLKASGNDYLYVGYYKPFSAMYIEMITPNSGNNELIEEYWNGSAWAVLGMRDETKDFQRSGFVTWERKSDWVKTTVNGEELYWVRFNPTAANTNATIQGINLVFCDDSVLKTEFFEIDNEQVLPNGQSSHIMAHVAARNDIIGELRGRGYMKTNPTTGVENLTQWDLLDIYEVREAAKYKALSNIMFSLSDNIDDHYYAKHETYHNKYKMFLDGIRITVDEDDDGQVDTTEKLQRIKISRLIY